MTFGVGYRDVKMCENGKQLKSYRVWYDMLRRCYDKKSGNYKSYGAKGITVCKEWLIYSNFKDWFEKNYVDGYVLDKDIKQKGVKNKVYSPENCIFISSGYNISESSFRRSAR